MNEGRLKLVTSQTRRRRKLTAICNRQLRDRNEDYNGGLERELTHVQLMVNKQTLPLKRSLLELRGYRKCLRRMYREEEDPFASKTHFHNELRGNINDVIQENHPRRRRLKETQDLLDRGLNGGLLLNPSVIMGRMDTIVDLGRRSAESSEESSSQVPPLLTRSRSRLVLPPLAATHRNTTLPLQQPIARGEEKLPAWSSSNFVTRNDN